MPEVISWFQVGDFFFLTKLYRKGKRKSQTKLDGKVDISWEYISERTGCAISDHSPWNSPPPPPPPQCKVLILNMSKMG